jgi:hypothetical protein
MTTTTRPCPVCGARLTANRYEPPMCGGCRSEPGYTVMSAAIQLRDEKALATAFLNIAA